MQVARERYRGKVPKLYLKTIKELQNHVSLGPGYVQLGRSSGTAGSQL